MSNDLMPNVNSRDITTWQGIVSLRRDQGEFKLKKLCQLKGLAEYEMGLLFLKAQEERWYDEISSITGESYRSFGNWVEEVYGVSYRKAKDLLFIARKIIELDITDQDLLRKTVDIGWSKCYHAFRAINKIEDANHWLNMASVVHERDFREMVSKHLQAPNSTQVEQEGKSVRLVAKKNRKEKGEDTPLEEIEFSFKASPEESSLIQTATSLVRKRTGEERSSSIYSILASHYIATRGADDEGDLPPLGAIIDSINNLYGVELVVLEKRRKDGDKKSAIS